MHSHIQAFLDYLIFTSLFKTVISLYHTGNISSKYHTNHSNRGDDMQELFYIYCSL